MTTNSDPHGPARMLAAPPRHSPFAVRLPTLTAVVFWPLLAAWTWKLVEPYPLPEVVADVLSVSDALRFVLAKSLHAGVYATLAGMTRVMARSPRGRAALLGLLLAHGAGTELAQYLMDVGRTGKVTDVLIDWAGITLGLLAARRVGSARLAARP